MANQTPYILPLSSFLMVAASSHSIGRASLYLWSAFPRLLTILVLPIEQRQRINGSKTSLLKSWSAGWPRIWGLWLKKHIKNTLWGHFGHIDTLIIAMKSICWTESWCSFHIIVLENKAPKVYVYHQSIYMNMYTWHTSRAIAHINQHVLNWQSQPLSVQMIRIFFSG